MEKIMDQLINFLPDHIHSTLQLVIAYSIIIIILIIVLWVSDRVAKRVMMKQVKKVVQKSKNKVDDMLFEKKIFHQLAHLAPALIIYFIAPIFVGFSDIIQKCSLGYITLLFVLVLFKLVDVLVDIYNSYSFSKGRPIKGLMQIVKIVIGTFAFGFLIVIFFGNQTATVLMGSIGGLSAVLVLVFRDSILGFVAGIQLSTGSLLTVGDWLQMDKFGADGEVIDISLTKIVVRNWDKTITSIPAYKFLEESFVNWQGMVESGGRRIKRSVSFDIESIRFLDVDEVNELYKLDILKPYLQNKESNIEQFNKDKTPLNQRRLTNIGTFRAYIEALLKASSDIQTENFTLMVRQLPPTEKGVPLEIYCFTKTTKWAEYETIQADLFDHLFAIAPMFHLSIFQEPTSNTYRNLMVKEK
jgi:miniconductance mechanosensitive channel